MILPTFEDAKLQTNKHGIKVVTFRCEGITFFVPADYWNGEINWIGPRNND